MDKVFKIHCSQIGKIMGEGKAKKVPEGLGRELVELTNKLKLSGTCISFLQEWYAGDFEQIHSKYTDKGNEVERDNIDFMASVLGYGFADKNTEQRQDEYIIGECDVNLHDCVVDVKSPWNRKTFLDNIFGIDPDYDWQLRGYMRLYNKPKAVLFYGLLNTPETDFYSEVKFDHFPENERWLAYTITRDTAKEQQVIDQVIKCREWLEEYHKLVTLTVGQCLPA